MATFDVDSLHDYRARRPPVSFVRDHYADYEAPRLVVRALRDTGGTPFLLLTGPEPDIRWEAFARAVREVVEHFGVSRVVGLGAVPMAVPHTRPIAITPHANRPELVPGESPWQGELRVPASAQALLEIRLGEWGHDALGFVAHIPHYLAQMEYPQAALVLLEHVEIGGHLTIDLSDLREAAEITETEVDRYLSTHDEVGDVVRGLEQQYDSFREAEAAGHLPAGRRRAAADRRGDRARLRGVPRRARRPVQGRRRRRRRRLGGPLMAGSAAELVDPARARAARGRPLPRHPGPDRAPARLRRPGRRPGGGRRRRAASTSEFVLHSLHSYFLRPGDTTVPIVYDVERIRDGRSFATRRVSARQHGRPIYYMTANFQIPENGLEHQDRMPDVVGPEQGDAAGRPGPRQRGAEAAEHWEREWSALDMRYVGITGRGLPRGPRPPGPRPAVDPRRRGPRRRPDDCSRRPSPTPAT